jgi:TolB-like protein/DNA-binding winged helix-turn-helix (wHTH) protein/Flp pilus assembly protein TadD
VESATTTRPFRFGVFDLDVQSGELRKNGLKIRLPEQAFRVLILLLERPGQVVTREELRQKLWPGNTFVDFDTGLASAVKKLRNALGDSAENPRFVETLPKRGYRFIGPVNGVAGGAAVQVPPPDNTAEAGAVQSRPVRRMPLHRVAAAAVTLGSLIAVLVAANIGHLRDRLLVKVSPPAIRSIAVLPLENLTGDSAREYFADGMTDALITELAQMGDLRVISRTSVIQYKGAKRPLPAIARELNVDGIVEGAVLRSGPRVRITAQLVDARTDQHLWARSYERDLNDIVTLQTEIAQAIAEAIVGKLTPPQRARLMGSRPISAEANELLYQGVVAASRGNYQGFSDAITYFEHAITKQPDFAGAYAAMSLCYIQFSFVGPLSPQEFMPRAETAARKALELDEGLAEAHAALGIIFYKFHWDWSAAEREFRQALELNPNYSEGHRRFSEFLYASGRAEEALAEAQRARELDPLSLQATLDMATSFRAIGQYERAIAEFRKALEKSPHLSRAHFQLGVTHVDKGDLNEGIAELETAVKLSQGNPRFLAYLAYADAASGKRREAQEILSKLESLSRRQYVSPFGIAAIHIGLGQKATALAWLERAYEVRDSELAGLNGLITDRRLGPLHSDPHFQDLVRRVGLVR